MVFLKGFRRSTSSVSYLLFTLLASHPFTANAQTFQPLVAYGASSVFIEGKAMYVTGGHSAASNISQTFSIDLSSPWTVSAPSYTKLNSVRSPSDYQIPSALDKDQVGWLIVSGTQSYRYDISQNLWSTFDTLANLFPSDRWYLQVWHPAEQRKIKYLVTRSKPTTLSSRLILSLQFFPPLLFT